MIAKFDANVTEKWCKEEAEKEYRDAAEKGHLGAKEALRMGKD
jgi:hypothetical protein